MGTRLNKLQRKLTAVEKRENLKSALNGFYLFLLIFSAAVVGFCLLENLFNFNPTVRTVFFFVLLTSTGLTFIYFVIVPLLKNTFFFSQINYESAAGKVGIFFPEIKDELKNALQLLNDKTENYSPSLIDAAFDRIYKKTVGLDFNRVVDFSSTKKFLRISLLSVTAAVILFLIVPGLSTAGYRLINFRSEFIDPPKFVFEIQPGNTEVTKGDNVTIKITAVGQQPKEAFLSIKFLDQSEFSEKKLKADSPGHFSFAINNIKSSLDYFAHADGVQSDKYKINVISRPIINSLEAKIIPPEYSKLPVQIQKDNGNITALPGTNISLSLTCSRQLKNAVVYFSDNSETEMKCNDLLAKAEFVIKKDINYKIVLKDVNGNTNANPISYSIKMLSDLYPEIQILSPNKDLQLGNDNAVPFTLKIKDDYGFSRLILNYRLYASKYRPAAETFSQISIPFSQSSREDEVYYVWNLSPLVLAEGEAVTYYFEVFDNDNINGPKSTKSPSFIIQVPSLNDIFKSVDNAQAESAEDLKETLHEADKLKKELQKISEELKQDKPQINWEEKQRIEKALDKFNDISKKVDEISRKLNETQTELMKNNLLSEETLRKYMELQNLLDQLGSEEFKEAMKKLQESLQNLMRNQTQQSLENFKIDEEYFRKSIERTVNLLKRIQIEQKADELLKRAQELEKKIEELKDKTGRENLSDKVTRNELTERQNDVTKDIRNFGEAIKDLDQKVNELKDLPKEEMSKLKGQFELQKNENLSQQASSQISNQQKPQAMQNQQQMISNMASLSNQIKNMQSTMQQQTQMQTFYDMVKIINDLITLSKEQEKLKNNTEELSFSSQQLDKNARSQNELQDGLEKIMKQMTALSQKTFAITPEMGKALGKAMSQMSQSTNALQNRNPGTAVSNQRGAMASLNEAAMLMKGSLEQMMQGGGNGGMMSLFQQLQKMAQQQMNLNQMTQMMQQGQFTQQQLAQMQRLAQQQELIRKSLEQLNQEAKESGQSKRLAANLDKILRDMQEVVTNLETQKLDDNLIKKQEHILSKLLDAQKSINERDYEQNRVSSSGNDMVRESPPELQLTSEKGKNKLNDELIRAVKEGYKKDYEDLIRKYFEALEKEK